MTRATPVIALLALAACQTNTNGPANAEDPIGRISGHVVDVDGTALEGVTVTVGDLSVDTDANGFYMLEGVSPAAEMVVAFSEQGFARNYKKASLYSWETVGVDATLTPVDGVGFFNALEGGVVSTDAIRVEFDPGTIVDEFGQAYTGQVMVEMTYLDPSTDDMKYAPGDLTALAFNRSNPGAKDVSEPAQLISYGMADITLTDGEGGDLNIAEGSTAGVDFVIQNKDLDGNPMPDVYRMGAGDTQQTWSFDTARGIWVEEGEGTVYNEVEDITEEQPVFEEVDLIDEDPESETYGEVIGTETVQTGTETVVVGQRETGRMRFEFEASHFSWWNCDDGFVPSCVTGQITDMLGFPVRSAFVEVRGAQSSSSVYTDEEGYYVASAMVGDTVTVTATTTVGGRNWSSSAGSVFLYGYGSSAADCQPIETPEIEVCRESGIVMADNLTVEGSTLDGVDADNLRAWFWEPTGEPENCIDPWETLDEDSCYVGTPDSYGDRFAKNLEVGIHGNSNGTKTVGNYLELRTARDVYRIDQGDLVTTDGDTVPGYVYDTVSVTEGSMEITENSVDLREGDVIRAQAPGSTNDYFGPIVNEEWMTIPSPVAVNNVSGALGTVNRTGGLDIEFTGKNNPDAVVVLVTQGGEDNGLLCKYADDGSLEVSPTDLGQLTPGWTSVSVYRPDFAWTAGPDGMPIRLQSMSGVILEADLH
ncbi:MAG: carboxypeptidase-like regulatory domain-containing protein [Myxococcota bacterium]|nr:carboxypeptidase-like regulatory domain-containing protein [Myxococcota bacterium]